MPITVSKENIIKNVDSYMSANFSGVTSSGDDFIQDFETQDWFVYDKNLDKYVFYNGDPRNIFSKEQIISNFRTMINIFLQNTAISFGYDSIQDALSYHNSGITAWREEAIALNEWRDNTISLAYNNIHMFTTNGIPLPSESEFKSQQGYSSVNISSPSRSTVL